MFPKIRHSLLALALCGAFSAHAAGYGSNLIVNGDAESGTTGWSSVDSNPLFDAVEYGSNWVLPSQPGPADRGSYLFVGGSGNAYAAGNQQINLGSFSGDIAAGKVSYSLSGWLGGWTSQTDNALLQASFLDNQGDLLGIAALGPVTPEDRNNITGLFHFSTGGLVPTGTASVSVTLDMERFSGGDNDGYADNLSLVLTTAPVPEPETYAMMLAGLLTIGAISRRRSRRNG